jgi:hypothetical protein
MMVFFYDPNDKPVRVSDYRGQKLKHAISAGAQWVDINDTMYAVKSIKKIAAETEPKPDQLTLAASTAGLTEEQRLRNIERIREMKKEFLEKVKKGVDT